MGSRPAPTERDRFWLDHEKALATSGLSAKAYATEHELSLHALYQARKRLRALGHLPKGRTRTPSTASPVSFSKIEVAAPCPHGSARRAELATELEASASRASVSRFGRRRSGRDWRVTALFAATRAVPYASPVSIGSSGSDDHSLSDPS